MHAARVMGVVTFSCCVRTLFCPSSSQTAPLQIPQGHSMVWQAARETRPRGSYRTKVVVSMRVTDSNYRIAVGRCTLKTIVAGGISHNEADCAV